MMQIKTMELMWGRQRTKLKLTEVLIRETKQIQILEVQCMLILSRN